MAADSTTVARPDLLYTPVYDSISTEQWILWRVVLLYSSMHGMDRSFLRGAVCVEANQSINPVSYTHLTLPTNREV